MVSNLHTINKVGDGVWRNEEWAHPSVFVSVMGLYVLRTAQIYRYSSEEGRHKLKIRYALHCSAMLPIAGDQARLQPVSHGGANLY